MNKATKKLMNTVTHMSYDATGRLIAITGVCKTRDLKQASFCPTPLTGILTSLDKRGVGLPPQQVGK